MAIEPAEQKSDHEAEQDESQPHEHRSWKVRTLAVALSIVAAGFATLGTVRFITHAKAKPGQLLALGRSRVRRLSASGGST